MRPSQRFQGIELSQEEQMRTLSVPLVDGVSGTLATVLDVSNLRETGAGDTEELRVLNVLVLGSLRSRVGGCSSRTPRMMP
jgi:hypothetical protein